MPLQAKSFGKTDRAMSFQGMSIVGLFIAKMEITNGKGMMPGFSQLGTIEKQAIIDFLFGEEKIEAPISAKWKTICCNSLWGH